MMRILKNKKGLDYAAMMVIVVLILVIYLYIQLNTKLKPFEVPVGEAQVAVLNAYQSGENALLFVDRAATIAAYKALGELASRGGMQNPSCGKVTSGTQDIWAWTTHGKECYSDVQQYDALSNLMNVQLNFFLSQYPDAQLPLNNYEFFVQQNSITGIALSPARVVVRPPPELRKFYALGFIKVKTLTLEKGVMGEYVFKPSFTIPVESKLDIYETLKIAVKDFYACLNSGKPFAECAQNKPFSLQRITPEYVIAITPHPVQNPYAPMSPITFALYYKAQ